MMRRAKVEKVMKDLWDEAYNQSQGPDKRGQASFQFEENLWGMPAVIDVVLTITPDENGDVFGGDIPMIRMTLRGEGFSEEAESRFTNFKPRAMALDVIACVHLAIGSLTDTSAVFFAGREAYDLGKSIAKAKRKGGKAKSL